MIVLGKFSKVLDKLGKIMAFCTVTLIAFLFVNAIFTFVPPHTLQVLTTIREYAILATLVIVGFEFAVKRNVIIFILYCIIAIIAVGFSFPVIFNLF